MSLAEELLNSMSEEVPVHTHPVPDTDAYFIIDPITKRIENTNRKNTVIMQYTHNSERLTFELPRYVDGHDMLECTSITVNADNIEVVKSNDVEGVEVIEPRVNSDAPDITDLRTHPTDPDKVICSWLISRNSTQLAGILSFSIEYKCVDSNGNVVYEWSTDNYDEIEIRARKKNGEAAVIEHTDLLEQWRTKIFGAGDSVMANIAAEGESQVVAVKTESETQQEAVELKGTQTLDSIPEDYTETNNMANEAVRSKGDAIVCEAAGESITLKDSANDYIRGLKVFGKTSQVTTNGYQLFDANALATISKGGATITNNGDGSFTVSGSGTLTTNTATLKDYTHEESLRMLKLGMLHCPLTKTLPYCYVQIRNPSTIYCGLTHSRPSYEITQAILDDEDMFIRIGFYGGGEEEIIPGTIKPMLYQDGDGTWEPYTGGTPSPNPKYPQEIVSVENATIGVCGKNLIPYPYYEQSVTKSGVTFTVNDDGSVLLNGTPTGATSFIFAHYSEPTLLVKRGLCYSFKALTSIGSLSTIYAYVSYNGGNPVYDVGYGATLIPEEDGYATVCIVVATNAGALNNVVIKPQLEIGEIPTEYEPYKVQPITLTQTLPGIPVTSGGNYIDADGQQWICDEIDLDRGVHVRRLINLVVDGKLKYEKSSTVNPNGNIYFTLLNKSHGIVISNDYSPMCDNRTIRDNTATMKLGEVRVAVNSVGSHMCVWFCSSAATVDEIASEMTECPSHFLLPIIEPIETPLTAEEITAFKALRTNYPNTTILNDAGAWMSVKYNADTKTYVENPKTLKLVDSSTGVVYELKIVNGNLTVVPV